MWEREMDLFQSLEVKQHGDFREKITVIIFGKMKNKK